MNLEEILAKGFVGMIPVYNGGNITKILTADGGQSLVERTCKTVLKNLARLYGVDLVAARKYYGSCINKKQGIPIPFTANLLLIPVKVREYPLGKNDGTLGYMNFQEIKEVDDAEDGKCRIVFHSNQVLLALVKSETMKEYMKNARLVKIIYLNRHFQRFEGTCEASTGFRESGAKYHTDFRKYLLELLLEILRQQKNQATK